MTVSELRTDPAPSVDDFDWTGPPAPRRTLRHVVVIDDHRTFADLLQFSIDAEPDLRCLGVAYDLVSGLSLVVTHQPQIVVIDYDFGSEEGDGLTASAAIAARFPQIHVVLLTGHADSSLLARAADAHVRSVLPKNGSLPDLLDTLRVVGRGGLLVHPDLLGASAPPSRAGSTSADPLSPREHDVLAMLMLGLRTDAMAAELCISENTCRGYVKSLLWKLGAHSRLEAVAIARRRGLTPTDGAI